MSSGITRLKDKVAVVTGGAQGIGRGIVHRLAQEGAKVAVADINEGGAAKTAAEISSAGGIACAVKLDVTSLKDAMAAAEAVERQLGPVDILVNNAGWDKVQHFLDTDEELWNRLIDINFRGVLNCVKAFAPRMLNRPGSKIVSIASDAGRSGGVNDAVYSGDLVYKSVCARNGPLQDKRQRGGAGSDRHAAVAGHIRRHSGLYGTADENRAVAAQGAA
jgi:2-hydroxycyclohexanecarboxyl-CoA dehydrogenase